MLRDHVARGTELGQRAKPLMERGELVPDDIVLGIVEERIARADCASSFVFDGFPRTMLQAKTLDEILKRGNFSSPLVVNFKVDHDTLVYRIAGRRTCSIGGEVYNVHERPPKVEGRCDKDGGELIQRSDDRAEVVRDRLAAFDRQTKPLVDYYRSTGDLAEVDGSADVEEVSKRLSEILARHGADGNRA